MSIAASVRKYVERKKPGQIFRCSDLPAYREAPGAVVRALGRLVAEDKIGRLSKGCYYIPKQGFFGVLGPNSEALLRDALYRNGRLIGYITGHAMYNRLKLSTQLPMTVTVAVNGNTRQKKDYGTIRIEFVPSRAPVREVDVPLLQYLDALRNIQNIHATYPTKALDMMAWHVEKLPEAQVRRLQYLALKYYNAAARALLGLILQDNGQEIESTLRASLNPLTHYDVWLDEERWPDKKAWNIR